MFMLKSSLEISSMAFAEHRVPVFLLSAKETTSKDTEVRNTKALVVL